ncbi:hypothetical protein I551_2669 [Mycobacterium ulcerans str. Harvey]|uniref:Uncharacterized protein n=1 Tax=Mycobacterium ulcerans str. Harvey TaxID=1299332 RepID=A0ABN0R1B1_MYCUL|nr:hypothetical protein I551_2669 [Mycobacterium ulcerans str. Harvey]
MPGRPGSAAARRGRRTGRLLYNPRLRRAYRIDDDIPVLLIDQARDVTDDEHARFTAAGLPTDSPAG